MMADQSDDLDMILQSLGAAVRYARPVAAAYRTIRVFRLKKFLRDLNGAVDGLPLEDRQRFDAFIDSALGVEVLADFADQAVRTRSKTALAALAILYAHPAANADEKAQTALALDGISERSIDVFLRLCDARGDLFTINPTQPAHLTNQLVESHPLLRAAGWDADIWVTALDDLFARGLLGRDYSDGGRLVDEGWTWVRFCRFTERSDWHRTLLSRARELTETSQVLGI